VCSVREDSRKQMIHLFVTFLAFFTISQSLLHETVSDKTLWFASQAASFYDAGYKNWCPAMASALTVVETMLIGSVWHVHQMAI
jgi:hypothetical protein